MQTEIEAKFLNTDHDEIRAQLKKLGATCEQPMRLMRRSILDYKDRRLQDKQNAWIRVRDEGHKITLTFKKSDEKTLGGAKEIEVNVDSFDKTRNIFLATGLTEHSYQENKRETWRLHDAEIVLDEWPWLNPYIEIEALHADIVKETAEQLGLDWSEAVFGSVTVAYYTQYKKARGNEHFSSIRHVTFGEKRPKWLVEK